MARVLITGMSGAGKSTLLEALAQRGFATVDTDDGWEASAAWWDEDRMSAMLAEHDTVVVSGTAENQAQFYDRFEHVVYLHAPLEVLLDRVRRRTTNPYGKSPEQQADITRYVAEVEPLIRRGATLELDGRHSVGVLTARLEQLLTEQEVISRKIKLDGVVREHRSRLVHADATGSWLFSPAGTEVLDGDRVVLRQPADGVQFFPAEPLPESGGWYVAWCWAAAPEPPSEPWREPWISVDLARPGAAPYTFIDLELDLWCGESALGIVDQDELEEAEAAGLITSTEAAVTTRAGDELHRQLRPGCRDAFGGVGWELLRQHRGTAVGAY